MIGLFWLDCSTSMCYVGFIRMHILLLGKIIRGRSRWFSKCLCWWLLLLTFYMFLWWTFLEWVRWQCGNFMVNFVFCFTFWFFGMTVFNWSCYTLLLQLLSLCIRQLLLSGYSRIVSERQSIGLNSMEHFNSIFHYNSIVLKSGFAHRNLRE